MSVNLASNPLVSVIVITYNRVDYLSQTLDSILAQSYQNFEVIIVDNVSEDGTEVYVNALDDPRIQYYRNVNNGIIAVNRNFGIDKAKGKYVALCDDDDLWLPEKLQRQVMLMEAKPNVMLCYTNAESFSGDEILKKRMIRHVVDTSHFNHLIRGNYIPNSSVLVCKKVFDEIGLITIEPSLREDYHMWIRIAREYMLEGIDESLIRYRVHLNNVASNKSLETLRSIRTLKHLKGQFEISWFSIYTGVIVQYLKYIYYRIVK